MGILLQIDFPYTGPFGDEMTEAFSPLASSIAQEKGLIWKIWTENREMNESGGIYLFEDTVSAEEYLKMHTARLESFGVQGIRAKLFEVNIPLSHLTKAVV
ncbi:MAG: monooxygenase [Sulfuricurvum sp.]|uniref:monooxygenase n=1 Tax=Sulfuricurvum sp. TaxID=2025608 RepID=UPI0025D5BB68|nr:monooxygenase [Sulfuricurvum sp.]MBV5321934.1 monooxygenase [Sulfuricurvum sp.]